ncbi:MAG: GAF domain-containing protein [Tabrizicola sp.]|uniref:GAF domain-containing protein n=1 Tax=Tabrizicola sp. TaxID=2005166 RepID=UPI0027370A75|nr:GAF domain-containing protein [Tabrizicola sp.]MDP3262015.1 GAF domain-containing protein [Tabrizicola sp.]
MEDDLDVLREEISDAFDSKARRVKAATRWVKIVLVLAGSLLAAFAAALTNGLTWPPSTGVLLSVIGATLAFAGGLYLTFVEEDSIEALVKARRALDEASSRDFEVISLLDNLEEYQAATGRLTALYTAYSAGRGTVEQALTINHLSDIQLIEACLKVMKTDLRVALGFQLTDFWTIGVYRAGREGDETVLRLVAHDRSLDCDLAQARPWKLGVGAAGIAFAKRDEVVVPDLLDDSVGTAFRLPGAMIKPEDNLRYRSMFAVPIVVGELGEGSQPWGVALATSSQPWHFGAESVRGVRPEEAVRSLAGIIALAVAASRSYSSKVVGESDGEGRKK